MSKILEFKTDKGFAKAGEIHTYTDDLADALIRDGYAVELKPKAKPRKKLFNKDKGDK